MSIFVLHYYRHNLCRLKKVRNVVKVPNNPNTKYFTIAGDWNPFTMFYNCDHYFYYALAWGSYMSGDDDGLVPLSSAATPQDIDFINLGITDNCHTNLLGQEEYVLVKEILLN